MRLGGDSQQTFGHCSLCIHPAVEPMATPSGHVYCKECIVEFLLTKTQELKRQREAFEAQQKDQGVNVDGWIYCRSMRQPEYGGVQGMPTGCCSLMLPCIRRAWG